MSFLLSILATFITTKEGELFDKIKNPISFTRAEVVFKIMGCMMIVMTFSFNGTTNDFFISYFFMTTSIIGICYLKYAGYNEPEFKSDNNPLILDLI